MRKSFVPDPSYTGNFTKNCKDTIKRLITIKEIDVNMIHANVEDNCKATMLGF